MLTDDIFRLCDGSETYSIYIEYKIEYQVYIIIQLNNEGKRLTNDHNGDLT